MKRCALAWLAMFFALEVGRAAVSAPTDRVAQLYRQGLAGDQQAVLNCVATLEAILRDDPQNQLARVYLGSAYTLRSRDLGFGLEKWSTLKKGVALMDAAAAAAPDDLRIRLVRALTSQSLPLFLGRRKLAQDEFFALAARIEREPERLSATDRQLLFLNAGLAARQNNDAARARKFFKLGLTSPGDPKIMAQLNAALTQI